MQTILELEKKIAKSDESIIVYLLNVDIGKTKICGLSCLDWVKRALTNIPYIEFDYDGSNLIEFLKPRLVNSTYTVVLYSNTPLVTNPSILKIMEYVTVKRVNACKFNGGFAFNNEYIKTAKRIDFDAYLPLEEGVVLNNADTLKQCARVLKQRILSKHISNGVDILGDCEIDEMVEIGTGSMVFKGNILRGNTIIGKNTILKENNVIENSNIGSDVCISGSNIVDCKIEDNVFILPYCYIHNATIRKNCYISSNIAVENRTIRAGTRLPKENK